jgi:hypothetical protein
MCPFVAHRAICCGCTKVVTIETALIRDPHFDPAVFRQTSRRVVARDRRHIRHTNNIVVCDPYIVFAQFAGDAICALF